MKPLKTCPICASPRIRKVRRIFEYGTLSRSASVTCYECPDCGEHIYDPEAADKILSTTPRRRKVSA
jgi:YgiT-type zinc finger domain-containing protein